MISYLVEMLSCFFATKSLPFSSMGALFGSKVLNL